MSKARDISHWIATTARQGPVELATQAEVNTGTDTERAVAADTHAGRDMPRGILLDVQVFTSNGTWTKPAGTNRVRVICQGGGGGGGSAQGTNPGSEAGGGGGGGAYVEGWTSTSLAASYGVTVGAGGVGGTVGNGGAGGTSTFATATNNQFAAYGGYPGQSNGAPSGTSATPLVGANVEDYFRLKGASGGTKFFTGSSSHEMARGGRGGWSPMGFPGMPHQTHNNDGIPADGYGAGGGGASSLNTTSTFNGGAGTGGIVIVESYT